MGQGISALAKEAQVVLQSKHKKLLKLVSAGDLDGALVTLQKNPSLLTQQVDFNGDTVWHLAVHKGNPALLKNMVAIIELWTSSDGGLDAINRILTQTASNCDEVLHVLLNLRNNNGHTPLHQACLLGRDQLVQVLMTKGANPWQRDAGGGRTALHHAAMRRQPSCISALLINLQPGQQSRDGVRLVDVSTDSGFTALHYAVAYNHVACVRTLLVYHANIYAANHMPGWFLPGQSIPRSTALHIAAAKGVMETIKMMLIHHVESPGFNAEGVIDPRLQADAMGRTPYDLAMAAHHHLAARLLHPSFPLYTLAPRLDSLPGDDLSLVAVAAAALRLRLLSDIGHIEASHPQIRSTRRMGSHPGHASGSSSRDSSVRNGNRFGRLSRVSSYSSSLGGDATPSGSSAPARTSTGFVRTSSHHISQVADSSSHPPYLPTAVASSSAPLQLQLSSQGSQGLTLGPADPPVPHGRDKNQLQNSGSSVGSPFTCPLLPSAATGRGSAAASPHAAPAEVVVGEFGRHSVPFSSDIGSGSIRRMTLPLALESQASLASSAAQDPTRSDNACGVCWDAVAMVDSLGCGHGICYCCARRLVHGIQKRPLACPFCRGVVRGFVLRQAQALSTPTPASSSSQHRPQDLSDL